MNSKNSGKVLIIVGPTAVGKTGLSLSLAEKINGEIISADSRLLYKGMDIGTAKPTIEERIKVKHHLIDVANPDETWSLAQFNRAVIQNIDEVIKEQRIPIIVGGTGQYIRSLVEGWDIPEIKPNYELRQAVENWGDNIGAFELHRRMSLVDPESGKSIQYQNVRRTVRALEVIFTNGIKYSDLRQKSIPKYDYKIIGLTRPRDELYKLVDMRIEAMFESGFVEEVERLINCGYSEELPSMSAIGYFEVSKCLQGKLSLEEAKVIMKSRTRQFVRRQTNWFKPDDPIIEWYPMNPDPLELITNSIYRWLGDVN